MMAIQIAVDGSEDVTLLKERLNAATNSLRPFNGLDSKKALVAEPLQVKHLEILEEERQQTDRGELAHRQEWQDTVLNGVQEEVQSLKLLLTSCMDDMTSLRNLAHDARSQSKTLRKDNENLRSQLAELESLRDRFQSVSSELEVKLMDVTDELSSSRDEAVSLDKQLQECSTALLQQTLDLEQVHRELDAVKQKHLTEQLSQGVAMDLLNDSLEKERAAFLSQVEVSTSLRQQVYDGHAELIDVHQMLVASVDRTSKLKEKLHTNASTLRALRKVRRELQEDNARLKRRVHLLQRSQIRSKNESVVGKNPTPDRPIVLSFEEALQAGDCSLESSMNTLPSSNRYSNASTTVSHDEPLTPMKRLSLSLSSKMKQAMSVGSPASDDQTHTARTPRRLKKPRPNTPRSQSPAIARTSVGSGDEDGGMLEYPDVSAHRLSVRFQLPSGSF